MNKFHFYVLLAMSFLILSRLDSGNMHLLDMFGFGFFVLCAVYWAFKNQ